MTNQFAIIALSGKSLSGKTASSKVLEKLINSYPGYKAEVRPFASSLKRLARDIFDWDGNKDLIYKETVIFGSDEEPKRELVQDDGRQLLINIGAAFRQIRPSVWSDIVVKDILKEVEDGSAQGKIYIIDDLRYRNEANVLGNFGNKITLVRVFRDAEQKLDIDSETDLDNFGHWNFKIDNNGDLEDLSKSFEIIASTAIKNSVR